MPIRRAKESFSFSSSEGAPVIVTAGQLIETDTFDGYKGREHLFEDVDAYVSRQESLKSQTPTVVETATAEPGEKRNVTPPKFTPRKDSQ